MMPSRPPRTRPCALLLASLLAAGGLAPGVRAESSLRLAAPDSYGPVPARTYDESGERVGPAELRVTRRADGLVEISAESGIEGAERTRAHAELAPDGGTSLRLLTQESRSFDAQGRSLGRLAIDHREGVGRCEPPPGSDAPVRTLALPEDDRVANVPLNLLLLPLARGEIEQLDFQIFSCRFGARLFDASARVARRTKNGGDSALVEIRYELQLPPYLGWAARPFLPQVAVWFDGDQRRTAWVGHRMPLFTKGPTVLVVRRGFTPSALESPGNGTPGR